MTTYYKTTQRDGTDFYSGRVDYAAGLASGKRVRPGRVPVEYQRRLCGPGILHAATVPAESLVGGTWPYRLFAVEGRPLALDYNCHPYKRGFASLRVTEELPPWQALGPNGQEVAALIERVRRISPSETRALNAAWDAAWGVARVTARTYARDAGRDAGRYAAWDVAWNAARGAGLSAVRALTVRDLITDEQYQTLAGPWLSVIGEGVTA